MNQFEFQYHDTKVSFIVNKVKYIIINDMKEYWCINRCIYQTLNKVISSEYAIDNNLSCFIKIDDSVIGKLDEVLVVNHNFSFEDDIKLGTKSLFLRYFNKQLNEQLISDEFLQLNSMMRIISDCISKDNIVFEPIDLNCKTLSKLFEVQYFKDDLLSNGIDLTYEETIVLQLDLIENSVNFNKRIIIFVELLFLTDGIKRRLDTMNNCLVIVLCFQVRNIIFEDNIYINHIDLEDEERVYERMIEMSQYYDIKDYKKHIKAEYLNKLPI